LTYHPNSNVSLIRKDRSHVRVADVSRYGIVFQLVFASVHDTRRRKPSPHTWETHIREDIGATRHGAIRCNAERRGDGSFKRRYPRGS